MIALGRWFKVKNTKLNYSREGAQRVKIRSGTGEHQTSQIRVGTRVVGNHSLLTLCMDHSTDTFYFALLCYVCEHVQSSYLDLRGLRTLTFSISLE